MRGRAGAQTFPGMRRYVIEQSKTRMLAFLNIAVQGMITNLVGELEDLRWASGAQAIARAREHPDLIVGIKVRLGYQMAGNDPAPAFNLAMDAADALGLPLMVHVIDMRPGLGWLVPQLRRGDIVTHCFHGNEGGILDGGGRLAPGVMRARERGVLFDIGHGAGSFSYRVARAAISQGFPPDTISSDLHAHNVGGPGLRPGHHALQAAARGHGAAGRHPGHHVHARARHRARAQHRRAGASPGGRPVGLRATVGAVGAARRGRGHRGRGAPAGSADGGPGRARP